jgi:cytochrome c oxidase assembly protein subunit 11
VNAKRRTAALAAAAAVAMVGLSFAAVPLYQLFCEVTGYGGTTQRAEASATRVLDQLVEVQFDANVAPGAPIRFVPRQRAQTLKIGETGLAYFDVENVSDAPVDIVATFNVAPHIGGQYFQKLQCFCFEDRVLAPREKASLPVLYFIDPAIADDPDARAITQMTLSYTCFTAPGAS